MYATYQYDNNGNFLNTSLAPYSWDRANRLTSVDLGDDETVDKYLHDIIGNRLQYRREYDSAPANPTTVDYVVDTQSPLPVMVAATEREGQTLTTP